MKDEILNNLTAVLGALNRITVSGKSNLANLSGSISLLEQTCNTLARVEILAGGTSEANTADGQQ